MKVCTVHKWEVDKDDKRFKICAVCKITRYRTDKELLSGT